MNRPLARLGIADLEELFDVKGKAEAELEALENELVHRSTARSDFLLTKVRQSRSTRQLMALARARNDARQQTQVELPGLAGSERPTVLLRPVPPLPASVAQPVLTTNPPVAIPAEQAPADQAVQFVSPVEARVAASTQMTEEQAYRCLKVPPSAAWEQVEQSRREIVAKAQPDRLEGLTPEKRKTLQEDGRLANTAYKLLLQR